MDGSVVRVTLSLIGPGVLFLFGLAFACTWLLDRRRGHVLYMAAGCWTFTLGALSQILHLPAGTGPNALVSGALYTLALLLVSQGLLLRAGRPAAWRTGLAILAAFTLLLAYFFYVDRNLLARVYIQNFGYGLLLTACAWRVRHLARARIADRVLFWVLLGFALQFFPRTLLTIGFQAPADARAFADSAFWQTLQLSLAVLGTALALAMLAACVHDILEALRRERDQDGLTGLLNRRAFLERIVPLLQGRPGSGALILCDVDHFKQINDTHGHPAGDVVLGAVAHALRHTVRAHDLLGRLGGEEFATFVAGSHAQQACRLAERQRLAVLACHAARPGLPPVSASFGVALAEPGDDWGALYARADALLYEAKRRGRNRVAGP
ncbi:GGDEF domain-containing protein [Orrella sp. JC864]|uniref:GGDEF domain-containing protein n=1 Tax=Orrella sp. JC864 TaxID=3120298 RepID=UPI0030085748